MVQSSSVPFIQLPSMLAPDTTSGHGDCVTRHKVAQAYLGLTTSPTKPSLFPDSVPYVCCIQPLLFFILPTVLFSTSYYGKISNYECREEQ